MTHGGEQRRGGPTLWGEAPPWREPDEATRRDVADVWRAVDGIMSGAGAACRACGSCCDFGRWGHQLFATRHELDVLVGWARDGRLVSSGAALARLDRGWCPFWDDSGRCLAWVSRPIGCRAFFCGAAASSAAAEAFSVADETWRRMSKGGNELWWYGPALDYLRRNVSCYSTES